MRSAPLAILLILVCKMTAQNWEPFPSGQRTFFSAYHELSLDSIVDGENPTGYFNVKAPIPGWQEYYDTMNASIYCPTTFDPYFTLVDDIYKYYYDYSVFFPIHVDINNEGEGWIVYVTSLSSPWESVYVSLDSIRYVSVFGIPDSVRYFSFDVSPPAEGPAAIDDQVMMLSKSHGLLNLIDFESIRNGNDCADCFKPKPLTGFIRDSDTTGIVAPRWHQYIRLQPGDALFFHSSNGYPTYTNGDYVLVVSAVNRYPDSVVVSYLGGGHTTYRKSTLEYILERAPGQPNFGSGDPEYYSFLFDDDIYLAADVTDIEIDSFSVPGEVCFEKKFFGGYHLQTIEPTVDCIYDGLTEFTFHSYMGLVRQLICQGEYGCSSVYLVGSIISDYAYGDIEVAVVESLSNGGLLVYPNPAETTISLNIEPNSYVFSIYAFNGSKVLSGSFADSKIDIQTLPAGVYILVINDNEVTRTARFVKK